MTNFNELIPLNEGWKALIKTSKLVGGFFQLVTSSKSNDQLLSFFSFDGDTSNRIAEGNLNNTELQVNIFV